MKEVSIEITHDCALKCIFCSSSAEHPSPLGELSFSTIKSIIDDVVNCCATLVSISGGEPLLHKDIHNILSYCNECNLEVYLYCSGVIFGENYERKSISREFWNTVYSMMGDKITVVFDVQSCYKKNAEYLNAVENSFELIIESIINAKEAGIACEIHVVPMKQNYREVPEILEFCKSIGITRVSFLRFVPQGRGMENLEVLNLSEIEFYQLQKILYEAERKYGREFIRLGHPIDFMFCVDRDCEITACRGGNDAPLILPNGDVHMCPAWKQLKHLSAGNIYKNSLIDIWDTSDFYIKFRELIDNPSLIKGQCGNCDFLGKCKGGCTAQRILLFNNVEVKFPDIMYLSPDPYCPLVNNYNLKDEFQQKGCYNTSEITVFSIISLLQILHNKKTVMYGDAWRKRGEVLSILSNISRKFDRIQNSKSATCLYDGETVFDTLADLCIYCIKYMTYIVEHSSESLCVFFKNINVGANKVFDYVGDSGVANLFDLIKKKLPDIEKDSAEFELNYYIEKIREHYTTLENCVLDNKLDKTKAYNSKMNESYQISLYCILCMKHIALKNPTDFYDFEQLVNNL